MQESILIEQRYTGKIHQLNISEDYVPKWTYLESIREVFQNWRDACVARANENNLKLILCPKPEFDKCNRIDDPQNFDKQYVKYLEFKTGEEEIIGWINYNQETSEVIFHNKKAIPKESILTLGITDKVDNPNMTGKHGEGAKLGGLAIIRNSNRKYVIYSEGKKWKFVLEKINSEDKKRKLCVVEEDLPDKYMYMDETRLLIEKLNMNEWISACDRILNFCDDFDRRHFIKPILFKDEGELLISSPTNKKFNSKLFVKNLFVQDDVKEFHSLNYFGLNLFKIDLDRDRNSIASSKERNDAGSRILADISCNFDDYDTSVRELFDKDLFFQNIFELLNSHNHWMNSYHTSMLKFDENKRKNAADLIFRIFLNYVKINPFIQPMHPDCIPYFNTKKAEYGFSDKFYQYHQLHNSYLNPVLQMSRLYESLDDRINKKLKMAKIFEQDDRIIRLMERVKQKFMVVSPIEGDGLIIYFKEFDDDNHRYKEDKNVFVSHLLVKNNINDLEVIRKVFSKLLEIFNISYERVIYCFVNMNE